MKKRQHSLQTVFSIKINGNSSTRSLRTSSRSVSREMSDKLASVAKDAHNVSKKEISPINTWLQEEDVELKLADEITSSELKQFSFTCIEVLATLSDDQKPYLVDALIGAVGAKLPTYVKLVAESEQAKVDFKEQSENAKEFMNGMQSLTNDVKVLECVQQTMCQKHRADNLAKRVVFLQTEIPSYLAKIGSQIGLPKVLMQSVSRALMSALVKCVNK